jgi:hypothetical protein
MSRHLLLGYTPPHQRDLYQCWRHERAIDCRESVDWSLTCYSVHEWWQKPAGKLIPAVHVSTAPEESYYDGTFDDYSTSLFFHDRESFKVAWSVGRRLRSSGHALLNLYEYCSISFQVGARHRLTRSFFDGAQKAA